MNPNSLLPDNEATIKRLRGIADLIIAHASTLPMKAPAREKWTKACGEINALLAEATGRAVGTPPAPAALAPKADTVVKWLRVARGIAPDAIVVDCGYDTAQHAKESGRATKLLRLELARADLEVVDARAVDVATALPA